MVTGRLRPERRDFQAVTARHGKLNRAAFGSRYFAGAFSGAAFSVLCLVDFFFFLVVVFPVSVEAILDVSAFIGASALAGSAAFGAGAAGAGAVPCAYAVAAKANAHK